MNSPSLPLDYSHQVSFFTCKVSGAGQQPAGSGPVEKIIDAVRAGLWAKQVAQVRQHAYGSPDYKAAKEMLPWFTPHGTFSQRNNAGLAKHAGLMALDFDLQDNPNVTTNAFSSLCAVPFTLAAYRSPSVGGVKALVRCQSAATDHALAKEQVLAFYEGATGFNLDPKQCTLSQPCFVSYDPDAYWNPTARDFQVRPRPALPPRQYVAPFGLSEDKNYFEVAEYMLAKAGHSFSPGSRHDYRLRLSTLLCEFGISESDAAHYIHTHYAPQPGTSCNALVYAYKVATPGKRL